MPAPDPIGLEPEEMRRLGYWVVDRVVEHVEGRDDRPALNTDTPERLREALGGPVPKGPGDPVAAMTALVEVELVVLDWLRDLLGLPVGTEGVLLSGGSMANLTTEADHVRAADDLTVSGYAALSTTVLHGRTVLRLCTINPRTSVADLAGTLSRLRESFG